MNPHLDRLREYPFQRLSALLADTRPNAALAPIALHIGEPRHPTPAFIRDTLVQHLDGLAKYPATLGSVELREAIAAWLQRRYALTAIDPHTQILPVDGSREALFAFAQAVIDAGRGDAVVVSPNPFYQIYEGAALLAGATPHYLNTLPANGFACRYGDLPETVWRRTQLIYVCSPGNPTGHVMTLDEWCTLFELSDRHGFVIAADECYSEIHFDEAAPPLGALQAARQLGRDGYPRLVMFSSLSKRSNVPGMRSGFVAGDAAILKKFLLYRTYHGCAMSPPIQAASVAAWNDEAHVVENRRLYREKFDAVLDVLRPVLDVECPQAAFYLWPRTPLSDVEFTRRLYETQNVSVLPGSFLARDAHGVNPGASHVRIALVATLAECVEAAQRIRAFVETLESTRMVEMRRP
ncbi:MAG TPA: succinyldiaminopimelate transaminase [Burkholderiales bacterium]|jgi:N-succinyldiaminopimelate aminotransferase|nr:succinyldiaminopimelate transaminase [Burkholderiales bacterium]